MQISRHTSYWDLHSIRRMYSEEDCVLTPTESDTYTTISDYAAMLYSCSLMTPQSGCSVTSCTVTLLTRSHHPTVGCARRDGIYGLCLCVCKARSVHFSTSQKSKDIPFIYGFLDTYIKYIIRNIQLAFINKSLMIFLTRWAEKLVTDLLSSSKFNVCVYMCSFLLTESQG